MTQRTSDLIDVGIRVAREFGVPCLMLFALTWCAREAAIALHRTVIVPVVETHTEFVAATSDTLRGLGRTQEQQAETLQEIAAGQREIQEQIGAIRGGAK